MLFLSSSHGKRRLVLVCVRLLVQSVMASSIPHAGMDEADLKVVSNNRTSMSAMSALDRRRVCIADKDYRRVEIQSHAGFGPGGANKWVVARG
jgi:hypothetical protein